MSQENVEIARRCTEFWADVSPITDVLDPNFWANRDISPITDVLDPNVVIDLSRSAFNPDVYRGHDGVRRWVENVDREWERFEAKVEEVIDRGDHVVTAVRISGQRRGSGAEVEMRVFHAWTFREGKVVRLTGGYRERTEALEAAGRPE
jgi:ketosteroid isomerase-like protein